MTAAEIYALVKDWPKEAQAPLLYDWNLHGPKRMRLWFDDGMRVSPVVAALAFEASGIRWLMRYGHVGMKNIGMVRVTCVFNDGKKSSDFNVEYGEIGGAPLTAISKAIAAVLAASKGAT